MTPVAAFVAMEEAQAHDLVAHVDASLQAIKRVLYGTGLLTPAIQATGGALMAAKVSWCYERLPCLTYILYMYTSY